MSPDVDASSVRVDEGDVVTIRLIAHTEGGPTLQVAVVASDDRTFSALAMNPRSWLNVGILLTGERASDDGMDCFTTSVTRICPAGLGVRMTFRQPTRAWRVQGRRAPRANLQLPVFWSELDDRGHPGPERESELMDLSVVGARLRSNHLPSPDAVLVMHLPLTHDQVNLRARVIGVPGDGFTVTGQMRVEFMALTPEVRQALGREVAEREAIDPRLALGRTAQRVTGAKRVSELYRKWG